MSHPIRNIISSLALLLLAAGTLACGPGGSSPEMQSISDQLVGVNQELVIVLSAADSDGDEVFYSFTSDVPDIYSKASLNRLPIGVGEFRWTPDASDVGEWFFDFTASDGSLSDTITIRIEVRAAVGGNSAPRFVHPQGSGTTLDLAVNDCLTLNVEVADGDSADVVLSQAEPLIEGATIEAISGLSGTWNWCPSESQIATDDRYTLLLSADDSDNPLTLHPYLLVLRSPVKPDCPGEGPVITHTAQDEQSLVNLNITAQITDDIGLKQEPLLYYSATQPSSPPDLSAMVQVTMAPGSGGLSSTMWTATIPNPVVGQAMGATANIYYVIVADDDDDSEGSCDHFTQAPETGSFQMTVTNPGGAGGAGLCESCTADVQCGGANDHCVRVGAGSESFCLQSCAGGCPTDYECSAGSLESVNGAMGQQCVPMSLNCSNPGGVQCVDDSFENNDSRLAAQANALLPANTIHSLVSCPAISGVGDDEDWFEVFVGAESTININMSGTSVSDLDLALYNENGTFVTASGSLSSQESISRCLQQGFYLIRVYAFGAQQNPYSLNYTLTPGNCSQASCQADDAENDDNAAQARFVDLGAGVFTDTSLTICSQDPDWYRVELTNNQLLGVDLTFVQTSSNTDLDIHLYDSNSVDLTPCSPANPGACDTTNGQSTSSNESGIYQAPATGCTTPCTFYIGVEGYNGSENSYDIRIEGA